MMKNKLFIAIIAGLLGIASLNAMDEKAPQSNTQIKITLSAEFEAIRERRIKGISTKLPGQEVEIFERKELLLNNDFFKGVTQKKSVVPASDKFEYHIKD